MFPVETLVPAYCEERAAADEAKRIARQQQQEAAAKAQGAAATSAPKLQRPPLSHTSSTGFLGNLLQGIVKATSAAPSSVTSHSCTPSKESGQNQKGVSATSVSAELEKLRAEQQRDVDICAFPQW